jgi:hypothetical protein
MSEMKIIHVWAALVGSLAAVVIVATSIGLMLCIVRPADALKHVGAVFGIVIVLLLIPGVLANLWSGISLGQRVALAVIGIGIMCWWRPGRQTRKGKDN